MSTPTIQSRARSADQAGYSELHWLSASELARAIARKELSPVEVVRALLERIERLDPSLNAFIYVDGRAALEQARRAEQKVLRGESLGPLHGVPVSIKSSIEVAGMPFEAGSRLRKGVRGEHDAVLVQRLKSAGAIVLGVTNSPELLMCWETQNDLYGLTNNPWDLTRSPGGSSGGEAAAIAAGMSAAGIGSDAGGSIRVPAHFSGICGLKPTPGRIPATGHYPPSGGPFALLGVVGPMSRTVEDLGLLLQVTGGYDAGDICAAPVQFSPVAEEGARKLKVGYFEDDGRTPVTPETRAAVRAAAGALKAAGFQVEPFRPDGLEDARRAWWTFFVGVGGKVVRDLYAHAEHAPSWALENFMQLSAADQPGIASRALDAWFVRDAARTRILEQMEQFPILLCPACAVPAFRHCERSWPIEGKQVEYLDAFSYTEFFNSTGQPAVVVPVAQSPEGLPIGVQVVSRPWREEEALAVAKVLDKAFGFRRPLALGE